MRRLLPLVAVASAACGTSEPAAYTIDTLPNGAVHVVNHAPSGWSDTLGWKLVLEAEHVFALDAPGDIARPNYPHRLANGDLVVLSQLPPFIQRYDADFTPSAVIGRKGSGPGEFENPAMRTVGDTIVVFDDARSMLVLFHADGTHLGDWLVPTLTDWMGAPDRSGRFPLMGRYAPASEVGVMWWSFAEARAVDSIIGPAGPPQKIVQSCAFILPYQADLVLTPTRSGMAWIGTTDADRFILTRTGRDTALVVENPTRPRFPVDPAQIEEMFAPDGFLAKMCGPDLRRDEIPANRPAWSWVVTDNDDNLWVQRPATYGGAFDVYDPEGRFLGEVPSPISRDENDYWQGDGLLTVEVLEEGGYVLRRYRIQRD